MEKMKVTKLDSARAQINSAIRMLYLGEDPIAIHTLVSAAFRILRDLVAARGIVLAQPMEDWIVPEYKKEFWASFNRFANFFKHADQDPDGVLEDFDPKSNEVLLMICFQYYRALDPPMTPEMITHMNWMMFLYPKFIKKDAVMDPGFDLATAEFQKLTRLERLEAGKRLLEVIRSKMKL